MMIASRLFLILILVSQATHGAYHRPIPRPNYQRYIDAPSAAQVAVGIGCIAAIGYGIYKFCDWLFTPSDEKVLQKGMDAVSYAHSHYDTLIGFMEVNARIPDNVRDQKIIIQSVNEPLLYEFAISYKRDATIDSILMNIAATVSSLQSAHASLADRIKKLRTNTVNLAMINSMQQIDQEVIGLLCKLEFIHEYFSHHRSYYQLFETEARIMRNYEFELNAINQNSAYVKEAVKASVMRHASAQNAYPYMHYVDRIQADCNALGGTLNSLSYNYANRLSAAGTLLQHIQTIHMIVKAEDAYHQELRDYKKEQLERQRLEAERAQAAAAAAQASALQQQAREMQRQNYLHAEQNRLNAERNAIMAVQASNPQPQVHIYT